MYNTRFSSNYFKSFCLSLIVSFFTQQVAFAAPALDVSGFISRPSGVYSLHIPESIALIDDEYIAGPGASTVYLLQDAHTNASGQFNMAKTIDFLIREKNTDLVFTEAADGEIRLSDLKTQASPDVMKFEATALVRKGYLHASEFLALTGSRDFRLIGVEDRALYDEGLLIYRQIMSERTNALAYLKKLNRTAKVLKSQIYSADLMRLDELKSDYLKDKLPVTDYVIGLSGLTGADSIRFKSITDLSKLKQMEDAIDFEEASRAQNEILMRLPDEDRDALHDMLKSSARKVGLREDKARTGFYALLKEKAAVILNEYPEFEKYLRYVDESKKLNISQVLEDLERYENAVAIKLAVTQDQRTLLTFSENLRLLENLWNMQIDPADFSRYQQNKTSYSTKIISGFFNKKIMDLEGYFEHAAELDESFDRSTEKIERFYNLTYQRDKTFIRRLIQTVNSESKKSSVLIAGGYHSPNLKALLKENGYSYVSITPQVIHETNYMRYESLLLSQIRNTNIESGTLSSDADKWMTLDISAPSTKISSPIFSRAQLKDALTSDKMKSQATPAVAASRLALFGDSGSQSDTDKAELLRRIRREDISLKELETLQELLTEASKDTNDAVVKRFRKEVSAETSLMQKLSFSSSEKQVALSQKVKVNQDEVIEAINARLKEVSNQRAVHVADMIEKAGAELLNEIAQITDISGLVGYHNALSARPTIRFDNLTGNANDYKTGFLGADPQFYVNISDPRRIADAEVLQQAKARIELKILAVRKAFGESAESAIKAEHSFIKDTEHAAQIVEAIDVFISAHNEFLEASSSVLAANMAGRTPPAALAASVSKLGETRNEAEQLVHSMLPKSERYTKALEDAEPGIPPLERIKNEIELLVYVTNASRLALFGDKGVQSDEDKQHLLKQISNPRTSVHKLESLRKTLTDLSEPTSDAVLQRFRQPVSDAKTWGNKFGLTSHDKQVELSKKVAQNQKEVLDALHSRWQVLRSAADRDILLGRIFESEITLDELISLHRDLTEPDSTTEDEVVKRFREFELTDEHVVSRGEVFSGLNELLAESTAMLEELLTDKYTFFQDTDLAETVLAHLDTIKKFLSEIRSYEESIYKIEEVEIYRWSDAVKRKHQDLVAKSSKTKRSVDKILGSILELLPDDSYQNLFQIDPSKGTSQMLPFVIALRHLTLHRKQGTSPVALPELGVRRPASKQAVGRGEINRLPTMITDAETAFVEYFAGDFDIDEAVEKYHKALSINTRWAEGALEADFLQHSHEIEQGFLFTDIEWMIKTFDPDGQLDESARADLRVKYAEAQKRVRQLFNEKLLNPLTAKYKDFPHITEIDRLGAVLYPLVSKEGALQSLSNEKIEWFIRDLKSNAGHGRDIPEPEYENDQIKNSLQIESALRHLYFELHVLRELRIFTSGVVPTENPWSQRGIQGARLASEANDTADDLFAVVAGNVVEGYLPQNAEERRLLRLFAAKVKNDNRYAVLWDSGHLSVVDVQDRGGTVEIRIQNQIIETVDLNRINREYTLANSEERLATDRVADALLAAEEIKAAITEGSESVQLLTENRRNNFNYGFKIPVSRLFDLDSIRDAQERESASQFLLSIMKWAAGSDWGGVGRIIFHISEEELNELPEDLKRFWSRAVETYPFITSTPIDTTSGDYVAVAWITDENESVENAVNIKMPKLRRGEMPLNFSNGITMAIEVFLTVVPDSKETAGEAKRYFSRATSGLGELLTDINHKLTAPFASEAAALEAFQQGRYGIRQTLKAGLVKVGEYLRSLRLVRAAVRISA